MAEYTGPSLEKKYYNAKFIRTRDFLFTTEPGDIHASHETFALAEGILGTIEHLKLLNQVDAGYYGVDNDEHEIALAGDASTLRLPINDEARLETAAAFQRKSPGYTVRVDVR